MFYRLIAIVQLCLLVAASPSVAAGVSGDWTAGKQAFAAGDYDSALLFFEMARDAGLDTPAVHYNIAVSQFQLGRYPHAGRTFELIAERYPQMRGLAEYNLGLVDRRLGAPGDARAHFLRAYELSPNDQKLRVLASQRLRELEPEPESRVPASRWNGMAGLRAGYDDNVALLDETGLATGTTTESPMLEAYAAIAGPRPAVSGLRIDASAYLVRYFDAEDFDQAGLRAGGGYEWRSHGWRLLLGLQAGASTLGGDAFDRKLGMRVSASRNLGPNAIVDIGYGYDDVSEGDTLFAGVAGSRQQFDLRYRWFHREHLVQARYRHEANDRRDAGVSPQRDRYSIEYRYVPGRGLGVEAGAEFHSSDFDDLATPRSEDLLGLRGALTYDYGNDWLLLLEYRYSDNDSDDPVFTYQRSQIMLGTLLYF